MDYVMSRIMGEAVLHKIKQLEGLAKTLFDFKSEDFLSFYSKNSEECDSIFEMFKKDIPSHLGYPINGVSELPVVEDSLRRVLSNGFKGDIREKEVRPFLCLTHDLDYVRPTVQQFLKKTLGRRTISKRPGQGAYLESLEKYLKCDSVYGESTLFVAQIGKRVIGPSFFKQWIIDPSYKLEGEDFEKLNEIVRKYKPIIGVHGSVLSLEKNMVETEKIKIERAFGASVKASRQHWLKVSSLSDLEKLYDAGITVDSSLGWNGQLGFRCGMARPFPIICNERKVLWEVPMLLMDGVLFDELSLTPEVALEKCKEVLKMVYKRKGGVCLNWHARTFASDYGWGEVYPLILDFAHKLGFEFKNVEDAVRVSQ